MIPESGDGLLCQAQVSETSAVAVKYGKLVFIHHISVWLRLDPLPYFATGSFEHGIHHRRDLAVLVVLDELQSTCDGERIWHLRRAAHGAVQKGHRRGGGQLVGERMRRGKLARLVG